MGIHPLVNPNIPEIRHESVSQADVDTETILLRIHRGSLQERVSIDEPNSKEEEVRLMSGQIMYCLG